jgi:hypothetical protein
VILYIDTWSDLLSVLIPTTLKYFVTAAVREFPSRELSIPIAWQARLIASSVALSEVPRAVAIWAFELP